MSLTPFFLRTEYLEQPLGIDEPQPRLSWLLESAGRAKVQSAYQIVVASNREWLEPAHSDLWDSGRVFSCEQNQIVYGGKPLESRLRCFWRVRVWDESGNESPWSETAHWELGLLDATDWSATWIGSSEMVLEDASMPCPFLRLPFVLPTAPVSARLYITARGVFEASLNGSSVGDALLSPGWTDYGQRIRYETHDVTALLKIGENVLGAILGDGWYAGRIGYAGQRHHYGKSPQLLAQLEIGFADGQRLTFGTGDPGGNWRVTTGPLRYSDFLDGERYDARLELPGWNAPGFDDSDWNLPQNFAGGVRLSAAMTEPIRRRWTVQPIALSNPAPGVHIFDLGQNLVGWVRFKLAAAAGVEIRLRHAEMLNADGTLHTEALRSAQATDTYICKGGELETFEPRFTFHGFRFVEITGYPGTPTLERVEGVVIGSDTPEVGEFECSSQLLNQLWRNIRWSQRGNFLSLPTDCPQRDERLGWLGDAQVFICTASFNADVAAFFGSWMTDVLEAQSPEGIFPDVAPRLGNMSEGSPAWGDAGIIVPWTLWRVYGDKRILVRCWDAMERWMDFIETANPNGLWQHRRGSDYGDWLAQDGDDPANAFGSSTPKELLATAYWAYAARLMHEMAEALEKPEAAASYQTLFGHIRSAFIQHYVHEDGWLEGRTQTGQVLGLHFDLVPAEARAQVAARLRESIAARGNHLSTGFVGVSYLLPALEAAGHLETAYALLLQDTFPSWGYSIRNGATTIWERWDGWTEANGFQDAGMNSFNHYSLGSVGQWLYTSVAGIESATPGFANVTFKPRLGGELTHARASYRSIRGTFQSAWTIKDDTFTLEVRVPPNATAILRYPFAVEIPFEADSQAGVLESKLEEGKPVLELGSGAFKFQSALPTKQ